MKLWDKNISTEDKILSFTTGMDPVFDKELAPFDVMGSMAHVIMLAEVGLIERKEAALLVEQLAAIYKDADRGAVALDPGTKATRVFHPQAYRRFAFEAAKRHKCRTLPPSEEERRNPWTWSDNGTKLSTQRWLDSHLRGPL